MTDAEIETNQDGFIERNSSKLVIVPNWGLFVDWVRDAGYGEAYLDINDSRCLALQCDYLSEQLPCQRCGHAYGKDWIDDGQTCPMCNLVQ